MSPGRHRSTDDGPIRQQVGQRWIVNGAALVAAIVLVVALAGNITGSGVGNIAGPVGDTVAPAPAPPPVAGPPEVQLAAGSDVLDMWRDVLSAPSGAATRIIAPTRTDGIHSIVRAVVPQLLPESLSPGGRAFLTAAADRLVSPVSNVVADSRLSAFISPVVALSNGAAAFVDHISGDAPDPFSAMLDLIAMPGDAVGAYRGGANLNLRPLASMLGNAGLLADDVDPDSLYIGFSGHSRSSARSAGSHFPRIGAFTQIFRDVALGAGP